MDIVWPLTILYLFEVAVVWDEQVLVVRVLGLVGFIERTSGVLLILKWVQLRVFRIYWLLRHGQVREAVSILLLDLLLVRLLPLL